MCGVIHVLPKKLVEIGEDSMMAVEFGQIVGQRSGIARRRIVQECRLVKIIEDV